MYRYNTGVMVVTTAVFWRTSPSGLAALSLMCGGDGLADIVGRVGAIFHHVMYA